MINYDSVYTKSIIKTKAGIIPNARHKENNSTNMNNSHKSSENKKNIQEFADIGEKDTLFWCFYICKYGYDDYIHLTKRFTIEKNEKISSIQLIKKNKNILKEWKLKKSEIESDILNSEIISLQSFFALCIYHKLNCLIIDGRKYYEINCEETIAEDNALLEERNSSNEYYLIHKINGKYTVDVSSSQEEINNRLVNFRNNYYHITNLQKPLRGFSSYSLGELRDICENLQISITNETGKKLLKKELYSEIIKQF